MTFTFHWNLGAQRWLFRKVSQSWYQGRKVNLELLLSIGNSKVGR